MKGSKLYQRDLRPCDLTGEKHRLVLYRVRIEQFVVDQRAAQRQVGLGAFMGSHALAAVLGPDEPMAHGTGETELLVSQEAMLEHAVQLLLAMEARDRASQPDVDEEDGA